MLGRSCIPFHRQVTVPQPWPETAQLQGNRSLRTMGQLAAASSSRQSSSKSDGEGKGEAAWACPHTPLHTTVILTYPHRHLQNGTNSHRHTHMHPLTFTHIGSQSHSLTDTHRVIHIFGDTLQAEMHSLLHTHTDTFRCSHTTPTHTQRRMLP